MKPILEVHNIGKKYRIQHIQGGYLSLRERLMNGLQFNRTESEDFWALQDVSFSLNAGDSLGIIGRNGAGKSTLLKILSRITHPSNGKIITRGRIASLLEVGTGFHPELTGRENIFFNGSLLGMKRSEIQLHFDEIVDFSGTGRFLDTPLKHYSSGMQLRLAFSVAAFLEPEILVIDEVLAVGDAEFQKKCIGKMEDVSRSGRTILFVSHNMSAVQDLCKKSILLEAGKNIREAATAEIVSYYQNKMATEVTDMWEDKRTKTASVLVFRSVKVILLGDQPKLTLKVHVELESEKQHSKAFLAIDIKNSLGITFMQAIPRIEPFIHHKESRHNITIHIELPPLVPDKYFLTCWVGAHNLDSYDLIRDAVSFEVLNSPTSGRIFPHTTDHGMIVPPSEIIES